MISEGKMTENLEKLFKKIKKIYFRNGTRSDNCRKNVGKNKYSFNKLRLYLLPQIYRPPIDTIADVET
jgi:hypothetical protein